MRTLFDLADTDKCALGCKAFYRVGEDPYHLQAHCENGCRYAAQGGLTFGKCACMYASFAPGTNACIAGCTFARRLLGADLPSTASISSTSTSFTTTSEPTTATTETNSQPLSTTANIVTCRDDDAATQDFMLSSSGLNMTCCDVLAMGGCNSQGTIAEHMQSLCPASCGVCIPSSTDPFAKSTSCTNLVKNSSSGHSHSSNPASDAQLGAIVGSCCFVFGVLVALLVVRRRSRRRTSTITSPASLECTFVPPSSPRPKNAWDVNESIKTIM
jgi:hypothetical protein